MFGTRHATVFGYRHAAVLDNRHPAVLDNRHAAVLDNRHAAVFGRTVLIKFTLVMCGIATVNAVLMIPILPNLYQIESTQSFGVTLLSNRYLEMLVIKRMEY